MRSSGPAPAAPETVVAGRNRAEVAEYSAALREYSDALRQYSSALQENADAARAYSLALKQYSQALSAHIASVRGFGGQADVDRPGPLQGYGSSAELDCKPQPAERWIIGGT